jgi:uncharacterized membrane protein YbhN (UPF0104 family)
MRIIQKLQPLFLALALFFIVLLLRSQWAELSRHTWSFSPRWLVASAVFLLLAWAVEIQVWRTLLLAVGGRLPYAPAARIWFLSAIVRYVPGAIWQPLSMTVMCRRYAIAPTVTLTSVIFYQLLALLATLPLAAVYVSVTGNWGLLTPALQAWTPLLAAAALAPAAVFVLRPAVLVEAVNWLLVKLKRTPLAGRISHRTAISVLLLGVLDWLLWGVSFALLTFGLGVYSGADIWRLAPHLVAAYPMAYAIGLVTLLVPSGLGVREGALYVLLAPLLGGGAVTVVALAMRVWTTLGELAAAGVSLLASGKGVSKDAMAIDDTAGGSMAQPADPPLAFVPADTSGNAPASDTRRGAA